MATKYSDKTRAYRRAAIERSKQHPLTAEQLRSVLSYDQSTGEFTWLVQRPRGIQPGMKAGRKLWNGYIQIAINSVSHGAHRLAWLHMTGEWPPHYIDHVDGNPSNNAWANLRSATNSQNQHCRRHATGTSSDMRGVAWNKSARKWQAGIKVNGKSKHLGLFTSKQDAATAYEAAAVKYYGEFAKARTA